MSDYRTPDHIVGLISDEGYQWLHDTAKSMREVVEVGCWRGGGTHALLTGCPGLVHAVDHWRGSPDKTDATHFTAQTEDIYANFMANVGSFANLRVYRMNSPDAALQFSDQSVDMICIDAGHDKASVDADMAAWFPKCRTLFCGHDWGHIPVREAVQALGRPVTHHPADIWSVQCDG